MIVTFSGVIIRNTNYGESDKIITILCGEYGKITALAKGARKTGSKFMACTSLFCYGTFTVSKDENFCYLREVDLIESFFDLRCSLPDISLAGYAANVCEDVATEDDADEMMALLLNTLFVLTNGKKNRTLVKAAFEMRMACICGFAPDVSSCEFCLKAVPEGDAYLDVMNGALICAECKDKLNEEQAYYDGQAVVICPVTPSVAAAVAYIVNADAKRVFSFSVKGDDVNCLEQTCEKYLLHHLERGFDTLDFYKNVKEG